MYCKYCGNISDGTDHCLICGREHTGMIHSEQEGFRKKATVHLSCRKCGGDLTPTDTTCKLCGAPVPGAKRMTASSTSPKPSVGGAASAKPSGSSAALSRTGGSELSSSRISDYDDSDASARTYGGGTAAAAPAENYKRYIIAGIIMIVTGYLFFIGIPLLIMGIKKRNIALQGSIDFRKRNKKSMIAVLILSIISVAVTSVALFLAYHFAGDPHSKEVKFIAFGYGALLFLIALIYGIVAFVNSMKNKYPHRPLYAVIVPFYIAFVVLSSIFLAVIINPNMLAPDFIKQEFAGYDYEWRSYSYDGEVEYNITITGIKNTATTHIEIPACDKKVFIYIKNGAFSACKNVKKLTVSKNVRDDNGSWIRYATMFGNGDDLAQSVPSSLTEVIYTGDDALNLERFTGFDNVTKITADNVKEIENIYSSSTTILKSLSTVSIKNAVDIHGYAFYGLSSLKNVYFSDKLKTIGDRAFCFCEGLESITIPNSVTRIGEGAFAGCTGLTSLEIPNSVTIIREGAFAGCNSLESLTVPFLGLSESEPTTLHYWFTLNSSIMDNYGVPNSLKNVAITGGTEIHYHAFSECRYIESISLHDSIEDIGEGAFYGCSGITSINIPKGVTDIRDNTFYNCSSLTSITIPDSVRSIGQGAFAGCSNLVSINIPDSVTAIGYEAFQYCTKLKSIKIPNSVTTMYEFVFHECSADLIIYCEAENMPNGWSNSWLGSYWFDNNGDYVSTPPQVEWGATA